MLAKVIAHGATRAEALDRLALRARPHDAARRRRPTARSSRAYCVIRLSSDGAAVSTAFIERALSRCGRAAPPCRTRPRGALAAWLSVAAAPEVRSTSPDTGATGAPACRCPRPGGCTGSRRSRCSEPTGTSARRPRAGSRPGRAVITRRGLARRARRGAPLPPRVDGPGRDRRRRRRLSLRLGRSDALAAHARAATSPSTAVRRQCRARRRRELTRRSPTRCAPASTVACSKCAVAAGADGEGRPASRACSRR